MSVDPWDLARFGGIVLIFAAVLGVLLWSEHRRDQAMAAVRKEASEKLRTLLQPPPPPARGVSMTTEIPPPPEGAKPVPGPCPRCDTAALHVEARYCVPPASLTRAHPQVTARWWPYLVCRACGAEVAARSHEQDARHGRGETVFERDDMATLEEQDERADRALEDWKSDRMFPPQDEPEWEDR